MNNSATTIQLSDRQTFRMTPCRYFILLLLVFNGVVGRIHNIKIESDKREIIPLANFGLTKEGFIDFHVKSLQKKDHIDANYG